jgi:hypothetical protein
MAAIAHSEVPVLGVYRALARRNRIIGLLRLLVPVMGLLVLASLLIQMFIASLGSDFTIGRVTIERNRLTVDTPSYQGLLADGGSYDITAEAAESVLDKPSTIVLRGARVILVRNTGVEVTAAAAEAELETELQQVTAAGVTHVSDSNGLVAEITGLHVDVLAQSATGGRTRVTYASGETLEAEAMAYDARTAQWTFTRAVMTAADLPPPPGEAP